MRSCGQVGHRGAFIALGNTRPAARQTVHGLRERAGEGAFNPRTGNGHVAKVTGDYERAERLGVDVRCLLIETWGGISAEVRDLLLELAKTRDNKLTHAEYDETTWAARTWRTFAGHRISVAVQRAAAWELSRALKLPTAGDPRKAVGSAAAAA